VQRNEDPDRIIVSLGLPGRCEQALGPAPHEAWAMSPGPCSRASYCTFLHAAVCGTVTVGGVPPPPECTASRIPRTNSRTHPRAASSCPAGATTTTPRPTEHTRALEAHRRHPRGRQLLPAGEDGWPRHTGADRATQSSRPSQRRRFAAQTTRTRGSRWCPWRG